MKLSILLAVIVALVATAALIMAQDQPACAGPPCFSTTAAASHQGPNPTKMVDRLLEHLGVQATAEQKAEVVKLAKERREKIQAANQEFAQGLKKTLNLTDEQLQELRSVAGPRGLRAQRLERLHQLRSHHHGGAAAEPQT